MSTKIFVNLPVRQLDTSKSFFSALGYTINPRFTDDNAACVVISDTIHVMLLTQPFFQGFTTRQPCDTSSHIEMILALSADSRDAVDALMDKALSAGASEPSQARDYGFMYQRSFADPDGHLWEVFYMNEAEFPQGGDAEQASTP
jgi:predicted lactoylglutathione lyase